MKIHLYDYKTLQYADNLTKSEYAKQGLDGAKCGYVRKVTTDINKVTCFYCLNVLRKETKKLKENKN